MCEPVFAKNRKIERTWGYCIKQRACLKREDKGQEVKSEVKTEEEKRITKGFF